MAAKKNDEIGQPGQAARPAMSAAPTFCANHRRRPRVATCGTCGEALCGDCIVHTPVGVKCRTCTGVKGAGVAAGSHAVAGPPVEAAPGRNARAQGGGGDRRRWPAALIAAGVLVLAVAGYSLATRDSGGTPQATGGSDPVGPVISERSTEFTGAGNLPLGGTLTIPAAVPGQSTFPAVLIVPGLGALDRSSVASAGTPDATRDALAASLTVSALGNAEPIFRDLAQALAKAGIASFRYDKRGTVAAGAKPDTRLSFDDEVADARAALDFLGQRQEVGSQPLGLLGHDLGGMVAMRAAAGNARVKSLVLVSTPSRPLADVLADDLTRARGPGPAEEFRSALAGVNATGKAPAVGTLSPLLAPLFPTGQERYLTTIMSLDPVAEAKAVTVPALVVRGGADSSFSAPEADRLVAALRGGGEVMAGGANTDRNLAVDLGHVHSNTAEVKTSDQDADLAARLAGWVQTKLR